MVDPSRPNGYEGCFHAARVRSLAFHLCDPNIDGCMYWDHSINIQKSIRMISRSLILQILQAAKIMRRFFYEAPAEIMRIYTTEVKLM